MLENTWKKHIDSFMSKLTTNGNTMSPKMSKMNKISER